MRRSSDSDALDLDLPSRIGEAADDQRARRLPIAQDLAASLAGSGNNVALVRQDGGDLDEIVQRHAGSLHLRFEILPSEAALLDRRRGSIRCFFDHLCICMPMNESPAIRLTMEDHGYPVVSRSEAGLARHLVTDMLDLHHIT
jgi:hypothetical protein